MTGDSKRSSGDAARESRGSERSSAPASGERRTGNPRRVRSGLRLKARDGIGARTPLAERWAEVLEAALGADELSEGLRYAKIGQIVSLEVEPGAVRAVVQGTALKPYTTRLFVGVYTAEQWEAIIAAMACEAVYVVKLLASELPDKLDGLLRSFGLRLLPEPPEELKVECTCGQAGGCKHGAAAGYLFAERLSNVPLLALSLRGMPPERLMNRLRQARAIQARGVASAHVDPMIPESQIEPPPLEECVEGFWRPAAKLSELQEAPPPQHVSHALLRRLGPSPLKGRFPLVGLLASVYDSVAAHAVRLRDRAERIDEARVVEKCGGSVITPSTAARRGTRE